MYTLMVLSLGGISFGAAESIGGNGFLAVYVAGLVIGNRVERCRDDIIRFHEGLSWLMQISIFVMLGLLVFPSKLLPVAGVALALAAFLILVARPLAVAICYLPFRPRPNELAYVSWVGLRGSVPIVLATFPATHGIAGADEIFNVVFFVVLTSVVIHGVTLVPAARRLRVTQ
jgi:cell volume regulation protein A